MQITELKQGGYVANFNGLTFQFDSFQHTVSGHIDFYRNGSAFIFLTGPAVSEFLEKFNLGMDSYPPMEEFTNDL